MAEYEYQGPGPIEVDGGIVRPGDVREFDGEPGWGPWQRIDADEPASEEKPPLVITPDGPQKPAQAPASQPPAPASASPPAASTAAPAPKQGE